MILAGGAPIPVASLATTLGVAARAGARSTSELPVVVVEAGGRVVAFGVDELVAEQEVVVKSLGTRFQRLRHVSGATILPTDRVALILNGPELVRTALGRITAGAVTSFMEPVEEVTRRLLVVDDSMTTRSLLKSVLEAAGYEVAVAVDGAEAWKMLEESGADLVVSDIEMPRMNGFALTEAIRSSSRFQQLPVVLVTARSSDQDKAPGDGAGGRRLSHQECLRPADAARRRRPTVMTYGHDG